MYISFHYILSKLNLFFPFFLINKIALLMKLYTLLMKLNPIFYYFLSAGKKKVEVCLVNEGIK